MLSLLFVFLKENYDFLSCFEKNYYHGKLFPNLRIGICKIQLTNGYALILYDTSLQIPTWIRILPFKPRMDCLDCVNHRLKNASL